ncbi:MAG: hypothetical protein JWQ71_4668 [Pedosphaera sp.]|nr:hypothetical protein [Pedosphaera sp.]
MVNQLAIASLPTNFPSFVFVPEYRERIAFLAGEPDRWRNTSDLTLQHFNGTDHYMDLEDLTSAYGMDPHNLSRFRYEFTGQLALARAAHPEKFPAIEPGKNNDHSREVLGFIPWAIEENFSKLKSGFSYLKTFKENGGTPAEIANAQANIVYIMGILGHYVGDAAQPLHTTKHHHGWVGENPNGYSTDMKIHSWIDGGYFQKVGGISLKETEKFIHPAQLVSLAYPKEKTGDTFGIITEYLLESHKLVEPLYQMEKAGKLSGEGEVGLQGKIFLTGQLVKGGQMLGNLWYTAWQQAPTDTFLKSQLAKRNLANNEKEKKP